QNRKVITLQVFQLSRSNFHAFRPRRGKAAHPRLLSRHLLPIHPESVNPNPRADRGCPRRYFLSPLENASYKRKLGLPRSQLAASAGLGAQVSQRATLPNEQQLPKNVLEPLLVSTGVTPWRNSTQLYLGTTNTLPGITSFFQTD
ncbi:unnamed protein product, partial [Bubo scandiacus]